MSFFRNPTAPDERRVAHGTSASKTEDIVEAARRASRLWGEISVRERLKIVRRFRARLATEGRDLARSVTSPDLSPARAIAAEIFPLADACRFVERHGARALASRRLGSRGAPRWLGRSELEIRREPRGVVLVVGPANYPFFLPGVQVLQALVAGNAVVVKPGRDGTSAALAIQALFTEAGLDPALLGILGEGTECVRRALDAGIDHVILTGSSQTGVALLSELAPHIVPATLELSGADPVIVLPGADLEKVAEALDFGLRLNAGATCIAPRRVFVPLELARELEDALVRRIRESPPTSIPEGRAARAVDRLLALERKGARIVAAERVGGGIAFPAVVLDAPASSELFDGELSAPVLAISAVTDMADAICRARASRFALGASVFGPEAEARRVARHLRAGTVTINDIIAPTADPRVPFGGRGSSGYGITRGIEGLLDLTVPKAIIATRSRTRRHLAPEKPADEGALAALLQFFHAGKRTDRLRALARLVASGNLRRKEGSKS